MAMAFQWKGTSTFALQAIVRSIREFEANFADVKHVCSPVAALMTIPQNFTGPGKQMVEYWCKKNMERLATDPHTFIAEFIIEILPVLQMNNQVREKSAIYLPEALQMQYLAKLKSMGCTEDMFWSILETEETDAISEKSSETPLWKSGKRNHANHALVCLLRALRENPHLCPNCLGEHKLSACTNISPRSIDNLAAWIIPSFGKLTGRKVHHEQREIARGTILFNGATFQDESCRLMDLIMEHFIVDNGAAVTVTDNHESHRFDELMIADSVGKKHSSNVPGMVNIGVMLLSHSELSHFAHGSGNVVRAFQEAQGINSQDGTTGQFVTVPHISLPKTKQPVTRATLDTLRATLDTLRATCFKVPMSISPITATLVTPHT